MNLKNSYNLSLKGFRNYFSKIFLSFIFMLLVPITIFGILLVVLIYRQTKESFYRQNEAIIRDISVNIQHKIDAIEQDLVAIKTDNTYANYNRIDSDAMDLYKFSQDLIRLSQKHSIIYSMYFYDMTSNRIYNTKSGMYDFNHFYDTEWYQDVVDVMELQRLPERINLDLEVFDKYKDRSYTIYNPKQVLSVLVAYYPSNIIMANINMQALYQNIADTYSLNKERGNLYFVDSNNVILSSAGNAANGMPFEINIMDMTKDNKRVFEYQDRVYFTNPIYYGKMHCVISYPKEDFIHLSEYFGIFVILIGLSLFVFLFILSYIVAIKLYMPINTLYSNIKDSPVLKGDARNTEDELEVLQLVFHEMNTYYHNSEQNLQSYKKIAQSSEFRLFLEGAISYEQFVKENDELMDRTRGYYQLVLLSVDLNKESGSYDQKKFRMLLQEVIDAYLQTVSKGIIVEMRNSCFAMLITGETMEVMSQSKQMLVNAFNRLTNNRSFIAASNLLNDSREVVTAYHQCLELLQYAEYFDMDKYVITSEMLQDCCDCSNEIILNYETGFIKCIVQNDKNECERVLRDFHGLLMQMRSVTFAKNMSRRIIVTLDKEFYLSRVLDVDLMLHDSKDTLQENIQYMKDIMFQAIEKLNSNDALEDNYCTEAKRYMEENYMRDINIIEVAERNSISYSYLSKIFKQKVGICLSDYLNSIRIEKGKEYLKNTNLTMNEIAVQIGYNNAQSFQRFFKKYENMTLGDYRAHCKKRSELLLDQNEDVS